MASSRSSSVKSTTNIVRDNRVGASDRAVAVSTGGPGDVTINMVADEAFELAGDAIDAGTSAAQVVAETLGRSLRDTQAALNTTQEMARTESAQIAEQVIKIGIPAIAVAYVAGRIWSK